MNYKPYGTYAVIAIALISVTSIVASGCGGSSSSPSAPVNQDQTISNMKQLGLALIQYENDYDGILPDAKTPAAFKSALMPYTDDRSLFVDPNNNVPFGWNASLSGTIYASFTNSSSEITFYDAQPPVANSIPTGFLDGHTALETSAEFDQLKVTSGIP